MINSCTTDKPKFSKLLRNYLLIAFGFIIFFIVFVSNVQWEIRINALFGLLLIFVGLPLCVYLIYFIKKLNAYTLETDSKKINQYPRFYLITITASLGIILFISSVICIYSVFENKAKNEIIAEMTANAEELNLEDVKIVVNSKNIEYDYYNVVVECSNLNEFSYSELFDIDHGIGCSDAFVISYKSQGDVYQIYPSTLSIYKNGESVYSDYWNSSSHKSASTDKSGYGGFHGTRPGSTAESIEIAGSKVKCKECGRHSDNGVNSLCDSCRNKNKN